MEQNIPASMQARSILWTRWLQKDYQCIVSQFGKQFHFWQAEEKNKKNESKYVNTKFYIWNGNTLSNLSNFFVYNIIIVVDDNRCCIYLNDSRMIPSPMMKWTFSKLLLSMPGPADSRRDCTNDALSNRKMSWISFIASLNTSWRRKNILSIISALVGEISRIEILTTVFYFQWFAVFFVYKYH